MQDPLTAKLGPLGGVDGQGFAGESLLPTRQITITDAHGAVIYDKRTTDTAKAADSHIAMVKYQRSGDWIDGVAAVEPIPAHITRKRRLKMWGGIGIAVFIFAGLAVSCGSKIENEKQQDQSDRRARIALEQKMAEARMPFTATVTLDLLDKSGFTKLYNTNTGGDTSCQGVGGYKDLAYNGDSSLSGTPGSVVSSEVIDGACRLTYQFENIPGANGPYILSLGHRAPVTLTEDELRAGPSRSIGG